ncbi:unnamed protein product [Brassica rapa subsp. trilocularis]
MFEGCVFIPQGLIGQCSSSEELRLFCSRLPSVGCSVVSIQYLADTITDAKMIIKYETSLYTRAPAASRPTTNTPAASRPATNTTAAPAASRPATNTTAAPAASRPATNTPAASRPATNTTAAPAASRPATNTPAASRPATNTTAASRPATNTTAAPAASRPTTNTTAAPAASRPATNTPAASRPATNTTAAPAASRPATNTTAAPAASRLTILPGFSKVIDTKDLISQECTITAANLGVGGVLPKEQVSLQIKDIHGRVWLFEHRYNNILESHSLANGWKPFLESKKLSPGDSLIFLKTEDGLTVGIRRAPRSLSALFNMGEPLSRIGSGALSVEELSEILGKPFCNKASFDRTLKFDYFPSVDSSWFVVPWDGMREKLLFNWRVGMKVRKMAMVKDQLREVCLQGTVTKVRVPWNRAFWKTLDVNWDYTYGERQAATNMWEIEPVLEETAEPVPEETTEERPSKKPCLGQEGSDTALTLFGFKIEPTSERRA